MTKIDAAAVAAWAAGADILELGLATVAIRKRILELGAGEQSLPLRGAELDECAIAAAGLADELEGSRIQ